jgi:hypothetical protein
MARILTIACGDYDRTHALVDGSVRPEGLEVNWLDLPHLEIWTRMLNYYDFDASEISLSSFTIAKTMGKPLVGTRFSPDVHLYEAGNDPEKARGRRSLRAQYFSFESTL